MSAAAIPRIVRSLPRPTLAGSWRAMRSKPATALGASILAVAVAVGVLAGALAPHPIHERVGDAFAPPSLTHPLGLDDGGVDMLSLLMAGARTSLMIGVAAALVATTIGGFVGLLAGYYGGWVDTVLMRITDYFLVVPTLPLMIVVAAVWGSSQLNIILVIGVLGWAVTARVVRAQTLSLRERAFVQRCRSQGASSRWVIARHLLPHLAPLLAAYASLGVADAIFAEAGLSFLGLGPSGSVSWGTLIEQAFSRAAVSNGAWWAIVPPGLCIAIVVFACSLVARDIEESLNPRLKAAHISNRLFSVRPLIGRGKDAV